MILNKKYIFITGSGKGIGESSVRVMIKNGGYVYALIRNKKDNNKFKNLKNIKIFNGDVSNINLIEKIIKYSIKNKKPINCLVNNAGIRFRKEFVKIKKNDLQKVLNINLISIFLIIQIFSKFWIKNKIQGNLVNLASIVGQTGFNQLSAYACSKGAIISLTKSVASELSNYGIRSNSVSPGFTKTSFYKKFKQKRKLYNWTLSRIPQKRWGESEEISNLITFLISDQSKYINGENINIDGGWTSS